MATLETFPQFNSLPIELQLKVYKQAFWSSNGFQAWIAFAHSAITNYLAKGRQIPAFWKSPRYQLRPGLAILLVPQVRAIVYDDRSMPHLLSSCRLARQIALEEWRNLLINLLIPLNVPCEEELEHVKRSIEELKAGKVGCLFHALVTHEKGSNTMPQPSTLLIA